MEQQQPHFHLDMSMVSMALTKTVMGDAVYLIAFCFNTPVSLFRKIEGTVYLYKQVHLSSVQIHKQG